MRMTAIEKHFVNSPEHTLQVVGHAQRLLDRIDVQAASRYLDVGCGVGATARAVAEGRGLDVTGIDVDSGQIDAARSRQAHPHLRFLLMDATNLQFHDAEFDIVATSKVTHHIPAWERAVSELIRVLRPGGYLIYTDFMFPSWLAAVGRRLIPRMGFPSANVIESLASTAGLTKVHQSRAGLRCDFIWRRNN